MTLPSRLLLILFVIASCVGCDQWTKRWAVDSLKDQPSISYLGDLFRFHYAENHGAFLSLGAQMPDGWRTAIFVVLSGVLVVALLIHLVVDRTARVWRVLALALIVAGGIGNIIDRISLGIVRDFMVIGYGPVRTGVFNIADLAITSGVIAIAIASFRGRSDSKEDGADGEAGRPADSAGV